MAIPLNKTFPNKKLLENDKEVIVVKRKIDFQTSTEKTPCDNCGNLHSSKSIYITQEDELVEICYFCNQKTHNISSKNKKYRKDEILNQ